MTTLIDRGSSTAQVDSNRFGPVGEHVAALVALGATFDTVKFFGPLPARTKSYTQLYAEWNTQQRVIAIAGRETIMTEIHTAVRYRSLEGTSQVGAPSILWWTAGALALRDLISVDGFTQELYDGLTVDWRTCVGPIHPDDNESR
jgi:hypothetical protein